MWFTPFINFPSFPPHPPWEKGEGDLGVEKKVMSTMVGDQSLTLARTRQNNTVSCPTVCLYTVDLYSGYAGCGQDWTGRTDCRQSRNAEGVSHCGYAQGGSERLRQGAECGIGAGLSASLSGSGAILTRPRGIC